jgi:hypothetical protein
MPHCEVRSNLSLNKQEDRADLDCFVPRNDGFIPCDDVI